MSADATPHVLIVDDEDIIRELLAEFLGNSGFQVTLAESAEEGLKLCADQSFAAVLVDYGLPGLNGLEFCRKLAASGAPSRLALMTGWGSMEAAEQERAISHVIAKPFDLMAILKTVQEMTSA